MPKQKVYISSTYKDLKDFRENLRGFFNMQASEDFEVCEIMEHMYDSYQSESFLDTCLKAVDECDIYIIILGCTAGSLPPGKELTYTELEYERALKGEKKIARFVYKGCAEEIKDEGEKERFGRFRKKFEGFPIHQFSNVDQFKAAYLEIFYTLVPRLAPVRRQENSLSTINRKLQVTKFTNTNVSFSETRVQYFLYRSTRNDHPHYLNFRISDVELGNHLYSMDSTREVRTEFLDYTDKEDKLTEFLVNEITQNILQSEKTKKILKIKELYEFLEKEMLAADELVIPIRIAHSLETGDERLGNLNNQLKKFKEHQDILKTKQVIFLINIEHQKEEVPMQKVQLLFNNLNPEGFEYDLGTLKQVTQEEVERWIENNFDNDPEAISDYMNKYFPSAFPKHMSVSIKEARSLMKYIQQQNK